MKKILIVFALLAARVHAAPSFRAGFNTGAIYTDSSANHYAMGPVGSGPNSITLAPQVIEGTGAVQSFTDSNYITVTTASLTGITTQGSIMIHWNRGNGVGFGSSTDSVLLGINTTSNGNFFVLVGLNGSNNNDVRFPTTGGYVQVPFTYAWITGRSYEIIFSWNGTAYQVNIAEDQPTRTYTTALNSTAAATISFASPTAVYIGRDTVLTGYYTPAIIDAVAFYSTAMTTDPGDFTYNAPSRIMWIGDSWAQGTLGTAGNCGTPSNADGYRYTFDINRDFYDTSVIMVGGTAQTGQRYTNLYDPFTAGVAGSKMSDVLSTVNANMTSYLPNPTTSDYAFLAFDDINDCSAAVATATVRTQIDAIADSVFAYSANVALVYAIRQTNATYCAADAAYLQVERDSFSAKLGAGRRVFIVDLNNYPAYTYCSDHLHPDTAGYDLIGSDLFGAFVNGFTPTPTFTVSPTVTPSVTPSATPSATPTLTPTPSPTFTRSPTFTISPSPTLTPTPSPTFTRSPTFTVGPTSTSSPTAVCQVLGEQTAQPTPQPAFGIVFYKPVTVPTSGGTFHAPQRICAASVWVASGSGSLMAALYDSTTYPTGTFPAHLVAVSAAVSATAGTWVSIPFPPTAFTVHGGNCLIAVEASNTIVLGTQKHGSDMWLSTQWGGFNSVAYGAWKSYTDNSINAQFCSY